MTYRKKLIEVALPLDAINKASTEEKKIRHGHPSSLHVWWSRKPLATCRAVLFASLIDDPSEHPEEFPTEKEQEQERDRLFKLLEALVLWENSNNEDLLARVRAEILKSTNGNPPPFLDPFAGGGSIPLEAQRLGLEAHASDLNPVAVLINKAMIEIPQKFAAWSPVNPDARKTLMGREWHGIQGIVDDVQYYGKWIRDEAERRIGYLYPKVTLPKIYGGNEAPVIAWLWVRTIVCPNPACGTQMPLTSKWWLSKSKGKEVWVNPIVDRAINPPVIRYMINKEKGNPPSGTVNRRGAICYACNVPVSFEYIRNESKAGRLDVQLISIAAEGGNGRVYLPPDNEHILIAKQATPKDPPNTYLPEKALSFRVQLYGMTKHCDLFTSRQLVGLMTFSDLMQEVKDKVLKDAGIDSLLVDNVSHPDSNLGAADYADAVITYLVFILSKLADISNQLCSWEPVAQCPRHLFGRQAIPMVWDFAEGNPFGTSSGSWLVLVSNLIRSLQSPLMAHERSHEGWTKQHDATLSSDSLIHSLISTDPPYYDNIGYAVM
jgi:putative DNA methylase